MSTRAIAQVINLSLRIVSIIITVILTILALSLAFKMPEFYQAFNQPGAGAKAILLAVVCACIMAPISMLIHRLLLSGLVRILEKVKGE